MSNKVVLIRPYDKGLVLHMLFYAAEVCQMAEYGRDTETDVRPQETSLAEQCIEQLTAPFQPA